jgi:hypothetical protein
MAPFFTSRSEWHSAGYLDEGAYVRQAIGYLFSASLLGLFVLVGPIGAVDPYWRSLPVLAIGAMGLGGGIAFGVLLFRREWRAAVRAYGKPTPRNPS